VLLFLALGRRVRLWPGLVEALVDEVLDLFFFFQQVSRALLTPRASSSPLSLLSISLPVSSTLELPTSGQCLRYLGGLAAASAAGGISGDLSDTLGASSTGSSMNGIIRGGTGRYGEIWGDMGRYKRDRLIDERHQRYERKADQRGQPIRRLQASESVLLIQR